MTGNLNPASTPSDDEDDGDAHDALNRLLHLCQVHVAVDHHGQTSAPVIVEDNPQHRTLFGNIEPHSDGDTPHADFTGIRAGSLLRAHGGFLLLHLHDLVSEEGLVELIEYVKSMQPGNVNEPVRSTPGGPAPNENTPAQAPQPRN